MFIVQTALARRMATLSAFVVLVGSGTAIAQRVIPDSLWVAFDDDGERLARITSRGEIFSAEEFVSGYEFQMYADSSCETDYHITAFKINGHRWKLKNWKDQRIVNTNAALLTDASRTFDATLHAGDTVTFFRNLRWKDPRTGWQDTNNYKSFDTLTYAVELARSDNGVRAALLDSTGILPRITPGAPVVHGMRPIMSAVSWVVPASLDGVSVFARVRVAANGSGEYDFTRKENGTRYTPGVMDATAIAYLNYFDHRFSAKPNTEESKKVAASALLKMRTAAGEAESVTMEFATAPNGGPTSVAVYDGSGRLVFTPYTAPASGGGTAQASYRFESSGLYLVCLLHNGRLVAARTITVGR